MEDELITFETAKLAKEKGYKGGTKNVFTKHHSSYEYDGDPNHSESYKEGDVRYDSNFYTVNGVPFGDVSNEYYTLYERPSQSSLQKWLREEHKIEIKTAEEGRGYRSWYKKKDGKRWVHALGGYTHKPTYEEALEKGLQEGLKLIK